MALYEYFVRRYNATRILFGMKLIKNCTINGSKVVNRIDSLSNSEFQKSVRV